MTFSTGREAAGERAGPTTPRFSAERISDAITDMLGSTASVIAHSLLFVAIFALHWLGVGIDEILLILTTAVSLEAIYLSIFIQRSTNRQGARIESAVDEIRRNTEEALVRLAALTKQEIDDVQGAVEDIEKTIEEVGQRIESALRGRD